MEEVVHEDIPIDAPPQTRRPRRPRMRAREIVIEPRLTQGVGGGPNIPDLLYSFNVHVSILWSTISELFVLRNNLFCIYQLLKRLCRHSCTRMLCFNFRIVIR